MYVIQQQVEFVGALHDDKGLAQIAGPDGIPDGCEFVLLQAETQNVRYRLDGDDNAPTATTGFILYATDPKVTVFDGDLTKIRFIGAAAGAILHVAFCKH